MPVGVLVEAGMLFGIRGNSVRVAAARLLAAGQIARDERGAYRLGPKALPIGRRVRSWRDLDRRTRTWSGAWLAALPARTSGRAWPPARRALSLLGFRALRAGLWVRPDNLTASVDEIRTELRSLGLAADSLVCGVRDLDPDHAQRARGLWDVAALRSEYRTLCAAIERGAERIAGLSSEEAMVESFLLGGTALRQLVRDPLLPDEICPSDERNALLAAMREYDRLGRLAWAELLKRWDVPYLRAPLHGSGDSDWPRLRA